MFRGLVFAFLFVPTMSLAASTGKTYDCAFKENTRDNWVSPRIVLSIDKDGKSGGAYDGIIHEVYGKPIKARVIRRNASSVQFKWDVNGAGGTGNSSVNAGFNVILNEKTLKASIRVYVKGFDNEPYGSGKCKPIN